MRYKKLDPISHILLRPDMYLGSVQSQESNVWIYDENENKIVKKFIMYNDGVVRCFTEAVSNAVDNFFRSRDGPTPMTTFEVS